MSGKRERFATEEVHAYALYRHLQTVHGVIFTSTEANTMMLEQLAELHALQVASERRPGPCLVAR